MSEKRKLDYSNPLQEAYRQASEELQVVTRELNRLYNEQISKSQDNSQKQDDKSE